MVKNLEARGAPLLAIYSTPTLAAHKERLLALGWQSAFAADLNEVYRHHLDPQDRLRIEGLEMFDEFEEWHLIMGHYCVAVGVTDALGLLSSFAFSTYNDRRATALGLGMHAHPVPLPRGLPNAD
jgi:tRNA wybutosine-synthesizing protein 4